MISDAARELGRRGRAALTDAQAQASRENGRRGGRPVRTITVGAWSTGRAVVHEGARHVGYTIDGRVALVAATPAARRWLKRHGYEYAQWNLREVFDPPEGWNGRCWAQARP